MPNFGELIYWEKRYQEMSDMTYDWLEDYDSLKHILEDTIKNLTTENVIKNNLSNNFQCIETSLNFLMLGCGNSELSDKLNKAMNFKNIYNIDLSNNVIRQMKDRYPSMFWEVMDARELRYSNSFFDVVIDKATMDTLLCGESSNKNVAIMLKEVQRLLKNSGVYILISYGSPDTRMIHLQREHLGFEISTKILKSSFLDPKSDQLHEKVHYVYICKKRQGADLISSENFSKVLLELEQINLLIEEDLEELGEDMPFN
jgi:ubiquinone/menaquinone biosynthesis C-methylase UbiE